MALTDEDMALIEKHLDGTLLPAEQVLFDNRMAASLMFANEVALHQRTIDGLKANAQLKAELSEMYKEVKNSKKQVPVWKPIAWAAVILLVISSFSYQYYLQYQATKPVRLYSSYFKPMPIESVTRNSSTPTMKGQLGNAISLYQQGKYQEAARAIENALNTSSLQDRWWVYLAICYMQLGDDQHAAAALDEVMASDSNFTRQHALWYSTMLNLKTGDLKTAKSKLERIYTLGGMYKREAELLLEEVD